MKILETKDYKKFNKLIGNRGITESRVSKIISSINKVGYIMNPIIVNEKMEIIDGQGRFEALKSLNLPIYYIVIPNIGIEQCISMNINNTNWKLTDYIESYAELGNQNFIYLKKLLDEYKMYSIDNIFASATGTLKVSNRGIKDGNLYINEEMYNNAKKGDYISFKAIYRTDQRLRRSKSVSNAKKNKINIGVENDR